MFKLGRTKEAMRWNGFLGTELAASLETYRSVLRDIDDGELDDVDRRRLLNLANGAATTLRNLSGHTSDMIDRLPPALSPVRSMELLQALAESSIAMLELGPEHPFVLDDETVDECFGEPFTQHWLALLLDGPGSEDDLRDARPLRESREATPEEVEDVRGVLAELVALIAARYPEIHAQAAAGADAVEDALQLAIQIAVVSRAAQSDGRDLRSYPKDVVYALMIVLGGAFQSAVQIATAATNAVPPLEPAELAELIAGASTPELLA